MRAPYAPGTLQPSPGDPPLPKPHLAGVEKRLSDFPKDPKVDPRVGCRFLKELRSRTEPLWPANLVASPLPTGFPGDSTRCVWEAHAHKPPRLIVATFGTQPPGAQDNMSHGDSTLGLSAKSPLSPQINKLGKSFWQSASQPVENLSEGSPWTTVRTKASGQSPPKGLKGEQTSPLCMGTEDLHMNVVPPFLPWGVSSSRLIIQGIEAHSPGDKGLSPSQCRLSLFGRMGQCVSDEGQGTPTPNSTHGPPEQSLHNHRWAMASGRAHGKRDSDSQDSCLVYYRTYVWDQ